MTYRQSRFTVGCIAVGVVLLGPWVTPISASGLVEAPPTLQSNSHAFQKPSDGVFHPTDGTEFTCDTAAVFTFVDGLKLGVCNASLKSVTGRSRAWEIENEGDTFTLVFKSSHSEMTQLLDTGGFASNAFRLISNLDRTFWLVEEYTNTRNKKTEYYPMFRRGITCGLDRCDIGPETCVVNLPKTLSPDIVQRVRQEKHRTFASMSDDSGGYTDMIANYSYALLGRALAGDPEAAKLLMHFPFELDAAPAEIVGTYQDVYKKAQQLHCPSLPKGS